ncbi:hypothetical protein E2C01_027454 [Portunus trituberculatus]|uniref:Uncharacterized protein n=1 Tax=Portunus trituberculatus TaxID=210409 RepID=A0A5B7ELN9_PORTR|nr:hypothetical protein [Portunus trituberculatus]
MILGMVKLILSIRCPKSNIEGVSGGLQWCYGRLVEGCCVIIKRVDLSIVMKLGMR